ncbi:hypothetical protein FHU35_14360 [Saccharopolyspora dendranthemae]|uniref:Uncharacterized protein n=2 Tax=Saccharopolyspora dendranthemae TaxID=1181886 RepID=A0A561U3Y7_9PSEU|nr:hypothetical protein FHU35_14360 [Saccharopolyspora dendranthemae]
MQVGDAMSATTEPTPPTRVGGVIEVGRFEIDLEVAVVDGREWFCCPVGGKRCGRVLVDFGVMGLDCMAWHVQHVHFACLMGV